MGLVFGGCIYTPGGQRPRRINENSIAPRIPPGRAKIETKSMEGGVGWKGEVAETYQKALFFMFKGYMIETQKRSNTEPHGIPEARMGFVGKVVEFSTIWKCRQ